VVAAAAFMATCTHTSVKPIPNTAVLVNYGTLNHPRCKRENAVCRVALLSVDGTFVPYRNNTNPVPLGKHAMIVSCTYSHEAPIAVSNDFTEEGVYYIGAQMEDDHCKVWITTSPPP
jgi:hypothetical protein